LESRTVKRGTLAGAAFVNANERATASAVNAMEGSIVVLTSLIRWRTWGVG
jgi:hypothetical protein